MELLTKKCPMCGKMYSMKLDEEDQKRYYLYKQGLFHIQDVFLNFNPAEREFVKTGFCLDCQRMIFGTNFKSELIELHKDIKARLYEIYQLDWMIQHGYSIKDLIERISGMSAAPTLDSYDSFEEAGFNAAEIWSCYDEFLSFEYEDSDFIEDMLKRAGLFDELYSAYIDQRMRDRAKNRIQEEGGKNA